MTCGIWGCILSELKEYTPQAPEEKFWGDCEISPQTPLKRPKEGPVGPSLG